MSGIFYTYLVVSVVLVLGVSLSLHTAKIVKNKTNKILLFFISLSVYHVAVFLLFAHSESQKKMNGDVIGVFLVDVMMYNNIYNPISLSLVILLGALCFVMMIIKALFKS